jgi:hypothetical protein
MLRIAWHLLIHDELFVDDYPRSKSVKFPKLPKKIQSFGIGRIVELLSKASEVIIKDSSQDLLRLDLGD